MSSVEPNVVHVAPSMRLSRLGLIVAFAVMIAAGLAVYALFPASVGGPSLPVAVSIDRDAVTMPGGQGAVLTPVVRVTNQADFPLGRLTIELNGQYLLMQASPLPAGESIVLPQEIFTDKRSSQRFNPGRYRVEEVVVTGQLPSNARGVSKFEFE
ncbi:hypothetical protein FYK55_01595 [Roseiconus nitratireducens]|uniref:Uncharacterized protein n=1 Tax=Roseiconus nitratireducens TaxID=2605748 RepID=A0A5M6DL56_9BACT|nr:hypothetical protein [Roseiconus nitratireducens]KAA5547136.1 hypothetical protein FYK55_01595 [Roseiconus nitratireducens]